MPDHDALKKNNRVKVPEGGLPQGQVYPRLGNGAGALLPRLRHEYSYTAYVYYLQLFGPGVAGHGGLAKPLVHGRRVPGTRTGPPTTWRARLLAEGEKDLAIVKPNMTINEKLIRGIPAQDNPPVCLLRQRIWPRPEQPGQRPHGEQGPTGQPTKASIVVATNFPRQYPVLRRTVTSTNTNTSLSSLPTAIVHPNRHTAIDSPANSPQTPASPTRFHISHKGQQHSTQKPERNVRKSIQKSQLYRQKHP
ncbi:hypothetical protein GGR54DRAFT_10944 [Hypoxylon sp. NC1633]|nr:hypothetical protein GGR54DRAFT_10944 [Hypoxylon sp. NC1633]